MSVVTSTSSPLCDTAKSINCFTALPIHNGQRSVARGSLAAGYWTIDQVHALGGEIQGKVIRLRLGGTDPVEIFVLPSETGVSLRGRHDGTPDVTLAGDIPVFAKLALRRVVPEVVADGEVQISGDIDLGQRFQRLLEKIDIDWEEQAARVFRKLADVDAPTPTRVRFAPDAQEFIWPVNGSLIASFGARRAGVTNQGIDVAAPAGTPVLAARGGRVAFVGNELPGYGKTVIIDHGDGYSSVYAWNGDVLVAVGQVVPQRYPIAKVGTTGRATAPSLHFEIRRGHRPQDEENARLGAVLRGRRRGPSVSGEAVPLRGDRA